MFQYQCGARFGRGGGSQNLLTSIPTILLRRFGVFEVGLSVWREGFLFGALFGEEGAEEVAAFVGADTGGDDGFVVEGRELEEVHGSAGCAAFGVGCAEDNALETD